MLRRVHPLPTKRACPVGLHVPAAGCRKEVHGLKPVLGTKRNVDKYQAFIKSPFSTSALLRVVLVPPVVQHLCPLCRLAGGVLPDKDAAGSVDREFLDGTARLMRWCAWGWCML